MQGTGLISRLRAFATAPFSTQMSLFDVALLTAFVITIAILWTHVLSHIPEIEV